MSSRGVMTTKYVQKAPPQSPQTDHVSIATTITTARSASEILSDHPHPVLSNEELSPTLLASSDESYSPNPTQNQQRFKSSSMSQSLIPESDHHYIHHNSHANGTSILRDMHPHVHQHRLSMDHPTNGVGPVVDDKLQRLVEAQAMQFELLKNEFEKLVQDNKTSQNYRLSDTSPVLEHQQQQLHSRPESPLSSYVQRRVSSPTNDIQAHRHLLTQLRKLLRDATTNIQVSQDPSRPSMGGDSSSLESAGGFGGRVYELMQELRGSQEMLKEESSKKAKLALEVEKLESKATEMKSDISQLSSQLEATRTQRTQLSSELQSHRKQISELSEALSKEKTTKLRVESQLERVTQLQDEIKSLKSTLIEEQTTRHQLMTEVEKLRKIEMLESKRVSELSSEVMSLKSSVTTQQAESFQLKSELKQAIQTAETLEVQLVEAAASRQKALDELKTIGAEHLKALDHQQHLQDVTEALNSAQSENHKLADEIARLKEAQSVRTCELGREVRQLSDALKEEQLQKYRLQDDLIRHRDAESERYQELRHEVERLCESLQEEQSQKSQLSEELAQLKEEAVRVAEASQESRSLREQLTKEVHQKNNLMEELRRLQVVHDAEIATTIKLHEELRRLQHDFDEEQSLRVELAEKLQLLDMRKGSYSDMSSELRAENELLWSRLEEARAKESQVAEELSHLRAEMADFRNTDTGRLLDELDSTRAELEAVRHQLESSRSQSDENVMMTSEEGSRLLVESLNGQIESLMKEVTNVKESHSSSEASLRSTIEQLKEMSKQHSHAEQLLSEKSQLLEERNAQCEKLQVELQELNEKYDKLSSEKKKREQHHTNEPEESIIDGGESIQELKLRISNLESELQDTLMQKVKAEEEVVSLRFELASNRSPRKAGNKGAKQQSVEQSAFEDKIATLESENCDLKDRLDSIMNANESTTDALSQLEELQQELEASKKEVERLKDTAQDQGSSEVESDTTARLQERLEAALASLEETEKELDLAKAQADGLSRTLDARAEERQELFVELESAKAASRQIQEELEATKRFLEAAEEELHDVKFRLDESEINRNAPNRSDGGDADDTLKRERDEAVSKAEASKARYEALERECERLGSQVEELERKKSELEELNETIKGQLEQTASSSETVQSESEALEASKARYQALEKECERLNSRVAELEQKKKELEELNETIKGQLEETESTSAALKSESDVLRLKNAELDALCSSHQSKWELVESELHTARERLGDLESDLDKARVAAESSTRASSSSSSTTTDISSTDPNCSEAETLRVQLKATQLGFLQELEKLKKTIIPNFNPRMSVNSLSLNQRNFLTRIKELEDGKFESASVAALPREKAFGARELHVEVSRLEGIASAQSVQLKIVENELQNTKAQLAKVEAGWKEEYRFYSARQTKLESDLEESSARNEVLQRALEQARTAEAEKSKGVKQKVEKSPKSPGVAEVQQRQAMEMKKLESRVSELLSKLKAAENECREAQEVAAIIRDKRDQENPPIQEIAEQRFWIAFCSLMLGFLLGWILI